MICFYSSQKLEGYLDTIEDGQPVGAKTVNKTNCFESIKFILCDKQSFEKCK